MIPRDVQSEWKRLSGSETNESEIICACSHGACRAFETKLSNIVNVNGMPSQLTAGKESYIDYYGRPWAQNWEKYFEVGWEKPETDLPPGIFDIFNKK